MNTHCNNCCKFNEFIREFDGIYARHIKDLEDSISLIEIFSRVLDKILIASGNNFGANHPITHLLKFLLLLHNHSYNCHQDQDLNTRDNNEDITRKLENDVKYYKDKYQSAKIQLGDLEKQIELIKRLDRIIYEKNGNKINDWELKKLINN